MKWPKFSWLGEQNGDVPIDSISLILSETAVDAMRAESERGLPDETGGVLVGHLDPTDRIIVTAALGPGPRALHTPTRFRRDGDYAQVEVDRLHSESGGRDDYIGEWHSHPSSGGASAVDRRSMTWIGENKRYHREQPLLIIMQRTRRHGWRPITYRWSQGQLTQVRSTDGHVVPPT